MKRRIQTLYSFFLANCEIAGSAAFQCLVLLVLYDNRVFERRPENPLVEVQVGSVDTLSTCILSVLCIVLIPRTVSRWVVSRVQLDALTAADLRRLDAIVSAILIFLVYYFLLFIDSSVYRDLGDKRILMDSLFLLGPIAAAIATGCTLFIERVIRYASLQHRSPLAPSTDSAN